MPLFIVEKPGSNTPVNWTATFASAGLEAFSVFEGSAPPADAGGTTWAAVGLKPGEPQAAHGDVYVVEERFNPPVDLSTAAPENPNLSPCLQRHEVGWIVSYIAADGSQCRCVYRAADAEAVRAAYRSAGMPFERVWRARTTGV